jgi:DNA-binding SARP family transcriptional activator
MEESLRLWRALEDKWWIAVVLKDLGMMTVMDGDIPAARAQFEEGVALARDVEDKWAIAVCLTRLGVALIRVDLPAARPILEEAITVSRAVGDKSVLWYALVNLAVVFTFQRDYNAAAMIAEEALPAALEIGNKRDILLAPYIIGMTALLQGDEVKAAAYSAEALALAREASYLLGIPLAILVYGGVAASAGQPKQAVRLLAAAESLIRGLGINMLTWGDVEVVVYKDYMQMAHAQLDEASFNAALAEGGALTLEQAIEEAQSVAAQIQKKPGIPVSEIEIKPRADLTIIAFGPAQVYRGEALLTSADWTYAKSNELLFYLLTYDFRTKEQIGLDMWPDVSPAQLRNTLGVRLHHLRRALGRADWIVFENNTYAFNRSLNYWFDVEAFETYLADARQMRDDSPEQAIRHFQDAVKLYRGEFLQDGVEGEWFITRQAELRGKYLEALLTLGQLLFAGGNYAQAGAAYKKVIEHDNYVEAAHRELMRCYARLGEQAQALRHYQELVQIMRDELDSPPAPETTALFERLRRGEEV